MHILIIHQAFSGPDDPGGTRHFELACHLVRRGHRVTILASAVNYLTGAPVGDVDRDLPAGLQIIRLPGPSTIHTSYAARFASFLAFSVGAWRTARKLDAVDVVWGTSPPLPQLLPAWAVSLGSRSGLVLEERDLWPEFAIGMGVVRPGLLTACAKRFKRAMYGRARRIIINSPGFRSFVEGYGVAPAKIRLIANGVDTSQFHPELRADELRREWGAEGKFVVLYAGAIGAANGLEVVLDAAERVRGSNALFVLIGDGKARPDLMRLARARGLENLCFAPAVPKSRMPEVLAASDACLAILRDIPLFRTTYPNKVFDYMAAGRPVVLAIDGVIREVVERANAGLFVKPGDAAALASAVERLMGAPEEARAMGRRGREAAVESFDRRLQGVEVETLLAELRSTSVTGRAAAEVRPAIDLTGNA
jgi:glycosyltransferase involved in cell wall biosynthesis